MTDHQFFDLLLVAGIMIWFFNFGGAFDKSKPDAGVYIGFLLALPFKIARIIFSSLRGSRS